MFGFLGPSGAGKSTLQKILTGQLQGYSGNVKVMGKEIKEHKRDFYERIGIDFEFPTLYERLSGKQNLQFFGSLYNSSLRDINDLLKSLDLINDADKRVSDYSKGMKSRLSFLRALINNPDILFLDEPTSGLDPSNARLMKQMILEEKAKGKTIILTTHNMQDAQELCDRVAFIVNGNIVVLNTPHNLILKRGATIIRYSWIEEKTEKSAECNLTNIGNDQQLKKLISNNQILTIHSTEPNLGDIFVEVTGRHLQ